MFHHVLPTSNGHSIHINMTLRAHLVIQNHIKFRATSPWRFWPFGCPGHGKSKVSKMSEVPGTIAVYFSIHHSKAIITITKKNVQHHKFLTQNHKENQLQFVFPCISFSFGFPKKKDHPSFQLPNKPEMKKLLVFGTRLWRYQSSAHLNINLFDLKMWGEIHE